MRYKPIFVKDMCNIGASTLKKFWISNWSRGLDALLNGSKGFDGLLKKNENEYHHQYYYYI